MRRWMLVGSVWGALAGCGAAQVKGDTPSGSLSGQTNGPALNGTSVEKPGSSDRARALAVVSLRDGVEMSNGMPGSVVFAAGTLRSPSQGSVIGYVLSGTTTDGSTVPVRIGATLTQPELAPGLVFYVVSYVRSIRFEPGSREEREWKPLCPNGIGEVLAIAGRWDYGRGRRGDSGRRTGEATEVTLACRGSVIAECIERFGYRPWLQGDVPHAALHAACVRALRADYCGNGDSLTEPKRDVNLYDPFGVKRDAAEWTLEAAWNADGATCVSSPRLAQSPLDKTQTVRDYIARNCPSVWSETPCAVDPSTRAPIVWTEHQP